MSWIHAVLFSIPTDIREVAWANSSLLFWRALEVFVKYLWFIHCESTVSLWIRPKKGWEEEYKWLLWELETLTALCNYLVTLKSLKCWLGGAPGGQLVQSPTHSCTPTRTRSGKWWLWVSKSWKYPCHRSHSLSEQPAHFLVSPNVQPETPKPQPVVSVLGAPCVAPEKNLTP